MALALKNIPLFQDLSGNELELVKPCLREESYQKGEVVFSEGEICQRIFIVCEGRIKLYRIASSGREQIVETLEPGDTCACNPGSKVWSCSTTAEAVTPCTVLYLARDAYLRLVETNSKFAHTLNRIFAERLRCFNSLIEEVSLKDVKKRLVRFLLDMQASSAHKSSSGNVLAIPFTREEIAQRLGAARETVARHLSELKRAKLIEIKPKIILIQNKEGLENLLT